MAYSDRQGFFTRHPRMDREELRRVLKVVPGGKAVSAAQVGHLETPDLRNDRFLRDHFLDRNLAGIIADRPSNWDDAS